MLAGGIAHDFNNMLMTILGNASLTLMDLPAGSPSYQHVKAVETAARRAADLTQQLLAYSGRSAVLQDAVSLNELTREMADLLQVSIGKSVQLTFEFDPDLPAVHADATQIRQVVMNLIVNASEAIGGERGDIILRTSKARLGSDDLTRLRVGQGLDEGEYVKLEVRDSGSGMDKATLDRLFESGAKLLQYLRDHRKDPLPVFALLDMTMPDWSGPETFKALLNECPELRVILMSGYAEEDTLSQFGTHRPAGFLQKPFGMEQLSDAIARWIEPASSS